MLAIDLNSDLGEGYGAWRMGDDLALLDIVSSANVACGFHAGSPLVIYETVRAAAVRGIALGAHVSYPDLVGFGRRAMALTREELFTDVLYQLGALQGIAKAAGTTVRYVKPHGALYNHIAHNQAQGEAVIDAIRAVDPKLTLMGLAGTPILDRARAAGLNTIAEAFADRAYLPNGALLPRSERGAVLHDPALITQRVVQLVQQGTLIAHDGSVIQMAAQSVCVHGDTPDAVAIARKLRVALEAHHIAVRAVD